MSQIACHIPVTNDSYGFASIEDLRTSLYDQKSDLYRYRESIEPQLAGIRKKPWQSLQVNFDLGSPLVELKSGLPLIVFGFLVAGVLLWMW